MDVIRQILLYACFGHYVSLRFNHLRTDLHLPIKQYTDFESLVKKERDYVQITSINVLITTLLLFRFLVPFPKLGVFVHTMAKAGRDLLSFMGLLFLILAGYTMQGHVTFGHVLKSYSTVGGAFESVVYLALGNYEYEELVSASTPMQGKSIPNPYHHLPPTLSPTLESLIPARFACSPPPLLSLSQPQYTSTPSSFSCRSSS